MGDELKNKMMIDFEMTNLGHMKIFLEFKSNK